jgi:shikimate dehydrogenase
MISSSTTICGLAGDPVAHSVSPAMHNAAFNSMGLDYIYLPFRVKKEALAAAMGGLRALNIRGLNVTIPHKVAVIPLLDELEPLAKKIGAVNTIVNEKGHLKGYNTDAGGFLKALLERGVEPDDKNIVILGAGGAARAISFSLADRVAELVILNRQLEMDWAIELAASVSRFSKKAVKALELNDKKLASVLASADILINATSVGMSPNTGHSPVPARLLRPGLVVFDAVYNPITTRLLSEAKAAGAETINGIDMLVGQGVLAFELWTGTEAPIEIMKKAALEALAQNEN